MSIARIIDSSTGKIANQYLPSEGITQSPVQGFAPPALPSPPVPVPAGIIGELLSSASSTPVGLTSGLLANTSTTTTVTLTPGYWCVSGQVYFAGPTAPLSLTECQASINDQAVINASDSTSFRGNVFGSIRLALPTRYFSVSVNTPVYVVGQATITGAPAPNVDLYATLHAVRIA